MKYVKIKNNIIWYDGRRYYPYDKKTHDWEKAPTYKVDDNFVKVIDKKNYEIVKNGRAKNENAEKERAAVDNKMIPEGKLEKK